MTSSDRQALFAAMQKESKKHTRTKKAAKEYLTEAGFLTSSGELSPNYGGKEDKRLPKRKAA